MIFIHSSFRTSSSYIWSCLRQAGNCVSYYEVFHEALASISQQTVGSLKSNAWDSKHPPGAPYFLEFLPLLREQGGVVDFDPSMTLERFIPPAGPSGPVSEAEAIYVRMLIDHAERRDRIPVLTETRTLGRVAGLKAAAPGLHAVLYRNLFRQWCSYTEQATCGNPYFLNSTSKIAYLSQHDSVIRDIFRLFPDRNPSTTDTNTFYLFFFLHVYLYSHATSAADLVIDIDRLTNDKPYRAEIEATFVEQNVQIDFSDASPSIAYSLVNFPCRADMIEQIQIIGDAIIGKMPSERGRAFTAKVVADFIDEFERHEFYSKRLRSVLLSTLREKEGAVIGAEDLRRQIADLQNEKVRTRTEHDAVVAASEEVGRQTTDLKHEYDRLCAERDVAVTIAEEAKRVTETMRAARERFGRERDDAVRAADETRRETDILRSERDAAAQDRTAIESEHRRIGEEFVSLSIVRDRLAGERDAALAVYEEAERERRLIGSRYDALLRWSLAYHDATAASLSWRLTRPLRWIGLGKPKRPPKPDFL